jgi:alpha-tubulin suppressor-like RCC1 family protein
LADGTIRVWGDNSQGQLGIGSATTAFSTPQAHPSALTGRTIVKHQFIGTNNTGSNLFVLDSLGDLWVAGYQGRIFGRGIAINANQSTFLKVIAPVSFSDFRLYGIGGAAGPTILAETALGELWAWGNNNNFQCGVGAGANISVPQRANV